MRTVQRIIKEHASHLQRKYYAHVTKEHLQNITVVSSKGLKAYKEKQMGI